MNSYPVVCNEMARLCRLSGLMYGEERIEACVMNLFECLLSQYQQRQQQRENEKQRRQQLGFNANNPWSQAKENRLIKENWHQQLGFNANNPWSQQKENRLKEENKEKQKQLFDSSIFLAAVAKTKLSSTQKFQLNELPSGWETQKPNSGKASYVSPDGKRFSSLKKVGLYLGDTLNDMEKKQLWTPAKKQHDKTVYPVTITNMPKARKKRIRKKKQCTVCDKKVIHLKRHMLSHTTTVDKMSGTSDDK